LAASSPLGASRGEADDLRRLPSLPAGLQFARELGDDFPAAGSGRCAQSLGEGMLDGIDLARLGRRDARASFALGPTVAHPTWAAVRVRVGFCVADPQEPW
jgi:hypothetical protein